MIVPTGLHPLHLAPILDAVQASGRLVIVRGGRRVCQLRRRGDRATERGGCEVCGEAGEWCGGADPLRAIAGGGGVAGH